MSEQRKPLQVLLWEMDRNNANKPYPHPLPPEYRAQHVRDKQTSMGLGSVRDAVDAASKMHRNYEDMKEDNVIGNDQYFHCKANCEAARHGPVGVLTSEVISNGREIADMLPPKFDPEPYRRADQRANYYGRMGGQHSNQSCRDMCKQYRQKHTDERF